MRRPTRSAPRSAVSNAIAVVGADVVILAVPYAAGAQVADDIRGAVAGKTIIDVTNPLMPDYSGLATRHIGRRGAPATPPRRAAS